MNSATANIPNDAVASQQANAFIKPEGFQSKIQIQKRDSAVKQMKEVFALFQHDALLETTYGFYERALKLLIHLFLLIY